MKHDEVKKILFNNDPDLKREYDELAPIYEIQNQIIELRTKNGLIQKELAEIIGTNNLQYLDSNLATIIHLFNYFTRLLLHSTKRCISSLNSNNWPTFYLVGLFM